MKKIILGLFLTVGLSGAASAGNGVVMSKDTNSIKKKSGLTIKKVTTENCIILTNVKLVDSNGKEITSKTFVTQGVNQECRNQVGGTVIEERTVHIQGTYN